MKLKQVVRLCCASALFATVLFGSAAIAQARVADDAAETYCTSGWKFYSYVRLNDIRTSDNKPTWHAQAWSRSYKYNRAEKTYDPAAIDKIYVWSKVAADGYDPATASSTQSNAAVASSDACLTYPYGGLYQASSVHRYWEGSIYHYVSLATHKVSVMP